MRFIEGITKLTDLVTECGERYPMNSMIETPTNDPKLLIAKINVTNTTATFGAIADTGYNLVTFEAAGIWTMDYTSAFDSLPAVFGVAILSGSTKDDRLFLMAEDGTSYNRSVTQQTYYIVDSAGAIYTGNATVYVWAIGVDADTTGMTNNSNQSPLIDRLNRFIAIGEYKNPETFEDFCPYCSCFYTETAGGGDAGDTLNNIANIENYARGAAGTYTADFINKYGLPPMGAYITPMGDAGTPDCGYGTGLITADGLSIWLTDGGDDTAVDRNYSAMIIGMRDA